MTLLDDYLPSDLPPNTFTNDMLLGAGAIAEFLFGNNTPENRKKVYRLPKDAPIGRLGRKLIASKYRLTVWYDDMTDALLSN